MNRSNTFKKLAFAIVISSLTAMPAFAATTTATSTAKKVEKMQTQETKMIDVRIDSLNKLATRIQGLRNISEPQKASIVTQIQALISGMNALKEKVQTEASTTVLKGYRDELTKNYRVYALAIPQLNILAAADRITSIADAMSIVGVKLTQRLGSSTDATTKALSDLASRITSAKTLAQDAVGLVAPLLPDQGDKDKMSANLKTMKDARAKLKEAQKEIVAGRKDIGDVLKILIAQDKSIVSDIKSGKKSATSTATSTQ